MLALAGGIALGSPMLLMVLHRELATSLVTVGVSVFIFAVAIPSFSQRHLYEILSATAAYAAVFVGTSF